MELLYYGAYGYFKDINEALIKAVDAGYLDIIVALLDKGADVDARDSLGETALQKAVKLGHDKIIRILIDRGADINVQDRFGETAILKCAKNGKKKIATLLLERGANVNVKNVENETALIKAVENGYDKIVALLLNNHASVNERDKNYRTPLMLAAGMRNRRVAAELLKHGAIIDHDPVLITWCLAIITKIADVKCIGEGENMFHLRKNEDNISLLDYIVGEKLQRQRGQLIDLLIKVDIGIGDWYCSTYTLNNLF